MHVVGLMLLYQFVNLGQLSLQIEPIIYILLQASPLHRLQTIFSDKVGVDLPQVVFVILSLPHLALDNSEADTLGITAGNTSRINRHIVEAELNLAFVRQLLHLALNRIQHIPMESSVLQVMVINNLLVILAVSEDTKEFLEVDIVYITGPYPSPGTEINIKTWRSGATAQLGNALQVTGVSLLEVENLAGTLVHHLNTDIAFPAGSALIAHLLTLSIQVGSREFYLVKDVLLDIVPGIFLLVVPLIRHIHMQQGLACGLQLAILLWTNA